MSRLRIVFSIGVASAVALLAASAASAQSIELIQESTGQHCPPVASPQSGGCEGDATGEAQMEAFGALVSSCDLELSGRMDEDGHGYVYSMALMGPNCTVTPCASGGVPTPWELELAEVEGMLLGEAQFCITSSALGTINCHISSIGFTFTEHSRYEDWDAVPCEGQLGFIHLTGHGQTHNTDGELVHN